METPDLRATLAANLNRMIDAATPPAVTLDTLDKLAQRLELQPWQLLLPDLDPSAPPDAPITEAERAVLRKLRRMLGD